MEDFSFHVFIHRQKRPFFIMLSSGTLIPMQVYKLNLRAFKSLKITDHRKNMCYTRES